VVHPVAYMVVISTTIVNSGIIDAAEFNDSCRSMNLVTNMVVPHVTIPLTLPLLCCRICHLFVRSLQKIEVPAMKVEEKEERRKKKEDGHSFYSGRQDEINSALSKISVSSILQGSWRCFKKL
jgi:hypothetical protein